MDLTVVGLGYIGLPLLREAWRAGLRVAGHDRSEPVVRGLAAGRSHIPDVPDADLAAMLDSGLTVSTEPGVIARSDTVVICVPTGLTGQRTPDLGPVRAAARTVAAQLRPGTLVVLESTSFPGTTEETVLPILEQGSGLRAGEDFYLGYAPERIDPGNEGFGVVNTPKVVAGYTPLCAKYCATFYRRFVDVVVVARGTREAELAKLLENTYRFVNIALVNEFAAYCAATGIDIWDVVYCAGTKPFGFASFSPGPGVGGHCIPVDPLYLADRARADGFCFTLVEAARVINDALPERVVVRAEQVLAEHGVPTEGAAILLLGVTYKPDVPDVRESPAAAIADSLIRRGARVRYHDPYIPEFYSGGQRIARDTDLAGAARCADLTILLQDHGYYDPARLTPWCRVLLDTRGKTFGSRVHYL